MIIYLAGGMRTEWRKAVALGASHHKYLSPTSYGSPAMNDPLRKALGKLVEAAELLNEHAPPGDELENAEALKMARDAQELADAEAASHPWCLECGEEFHDDDTGGYNPECRCGKEWCVGLCRSCCHAVGEKYPPDEDEV